MATRIGSDVTVVEAATEIKIGLVIPDTVEELQAIWGDHGEIRVDILGRRRRRRVFNPRVSLTSWSVHRERLPMTLEWTADSDCTVEAFRVEDREPRPFDNGPSDLLAGDLFRLTLRP